jgi:hypothetical protein
MKTVYQTLLSAALALGTSLAVAQDEQKPAPPAPLPPPVPGSNIPPPGRPNPLDALPPSTPDRDGRHHGDRRDGGPRPPEDGRRGEAPYYPEGDGGRRGPGYWLSPQPPVPSKPTPYIGVITTPPPPVLSAQLSLAEGFGLVVNDVLPDSPAAKAGVQRYDVLTKFNDQQLVDPGQFATLVRALSKGTEASLTLLRKAQEQKVTVTVDERLLPERRVYPGPGMFPGGDMRHMHGDLDNGPGQMQERAALMQERARAYGEKMREYQERMKDWQKNPSAEKPQPPEPPAVEPQSSIQPEDILREVRPGGVAQIRLLRPDGVVTYNTANAKLLMKDDTGEIELTTHDGKRSLVARNVQGETVFDGPIDTEDQRKALPEDVRKKIELIEVQRKLTQLPQPSPDSVLLPEVQ